MASPAHRCAAEHRLRITDLDDGRNLKEQFYTTQRTSLRNLKFRQETNFVCLFVVYLTTLSAAQIIQRGMVE
jgi:hypothetical protein